jgi:glycosyltransferase involved in cell wall biosynthesis
MTNRRVICLLQTIESSVFEIRLKKPLELCQELYGWNVSYNIIFDFDIDSVRPMDIYIIQRNPSDWIVQLILDIQSAGGLVVFELDDLITEMPYFLQHHVDFIQGRTNLQEALRVSNMVSVTTQRLASQMYQYNDNVHVVPNSAGCNIVKTAALSDVKPSDMTLIVASSDKVLVDMLIVPLLTVQKKYNIKITAIGPIADVFISAGIDVIKHNLLTYTEFQQLIRGIENLVGLIPLDDSLFSSCKSPVKYFDYSLAGVPTIASNVAPYADFIENEEGALLTENSNKLWIESIERLVCSFDLRSRLAYQAKQNVMRNHNLNVSAKAWHCIFSSISNMSIYARVKFAIQTRLSRLLV